MQAIKEAMPQKKSEYEKPEVIKKKILELENKIIKTLEELK